MDLVAELVAGDAAVEDEVAADDADPLVDSDVEVVEADRQAGHEPRRQHEAVGVRVRFLRLHVRVAADQAVVLIRRVRKDVAELSRLHAGTRALLLGHTSWRRTDGPARARIAVERELHARPQEQLLNVRRAYGTLVAGAQANVFHRRPVEAQLVRVGLEVEVIVRVAIPGFERHGLCERLVLDQRQARLGEQLAHVERAERIERRCALSGQVAGLERLVGAQLRTLRTVLRAESDAERIGRRRQLDAEVAGDGGTQHLLRGRAFRHTRDLQICELLGRDAARLEDVVRHAARIVVGEDVVRVDPANDLAERRGARTVVGDGIQRPAEARAREVVLIVLGKNRRAVQPIDVVMPVIGDVAAQPDDPAERRMTQIVETAAALDVASTDRGQDVARVAIAAAEHVDHLLGEQRIVAVEYLVAEERRLARAGAEERAARGDLRLRAVVHEHELGVDARLLAEVVVREQAGRLALVGPLVIVVGREVELIGRRPGAQRAARIEREVAVTRAVGRIAAADDEARNAGSARAAAVERIVRRVGGYGQRAGAEVARILADLAQRAVAEVHGRVAAAVRRVDARDERQIPGLAVHDVALGQLEIARPHQVGDVAVAVVLIEAVLRIDAHAFEVVVHDEVHDTGDGIGAVYGGCAARQHFDTLDQRGRNLVEIRRCRAVLRRVARHQPAVVDQHQRALRTEIAQVDGRGAGRAVRDVAAEVGERLRQVVDQVLDARDALDLHGFRADRGDRTDAGEVRLRDARARDHHLLNARIRVLRLRGRYHRDSRACQQRTAHCASDRQIVRHDWGLLMLSGSHTHSG